MVDGAWCVSGAGVECAGKWRILLGFGVGITGRVFGFQFQVFSPKKLAGERVWWSDEFSVLSFQFSVRRWIRVRMHRVASKPGPKPDGG